MCLFFGTVLSLSTLIVLLNDLKQIYTFLMTRFIQNVVLSWITHQLQRLSR